MDEQVLGAGRQPQMRSPGRACSVATGSWAGSATWPLRLGPGRRTPPLEADPAGQHAGCAGRAPAHGDPPARRAARAGAASRASARARHRPWAADATARTMAPGMTVPGQHRPAARMPRSGRIS